MQDKTPIQHLLEWLKEENLITKDQAEKISGPLYLTIKNHYVLNNAKAPNTTSN